MRKLLAALALCFGISLPADGAVLFSGGEFPDFVCTGACSSGASFRATWARMSVGFGSSGADPPAAMIGTGNFTPTTDI